MPTATLKKPTRRWATQAAANAAAASAKPAPADRATTIRNQERRNAIRDRASRRRGPWIAAGGTAATSALSWGFTALFATADVDALPVAASVASLPVAIGFIAAWKAREQSQWLPDIAAGTLAAAGLTFWTGMTGPTWLHALVLLVATVACSARWWSANPVGPGVPPVYTDPEPEPEPDEQAVEPEPVAEPEPEVDEYVLDWERYNACKDGYVEHSRLTNRQSDEYTVSYDVELQRGKHTYRNLLANAEHLAGGLDLPSDKLVFEPIDGAAPSRARMTIITTDPVADVRFYSGPQVTVTGSSGVIDGVARYADGRGEMGISMWNSQGMVPTAIIGKTGGGKSAAANIASVGALSTGVMNLLYIDPKGNSSSALRQTARIAIIGPENAARAPKLIEAILEARRAYTVENDIDKLRPSAQMPGWQVLHDEFSELTNRGYTKEAKAWCSVVNTVRSLGIWPVALSQAMHETKWGDDQTRSAFATQLIVFRMKTKSDNLMPGLEYRPHNLPKRPGMAVYAFEEGDRSNVPVRWDWLPSDADDEIDEEPPYRTSSALAKFNRQPEPNELDRMAIESVLGPAVDGRWVVGPGGTHTFPDDDSAAPAPTANRKPRGGFGLKPAPDPDGNGELSPVQRTVLEIVRGGTTQVGEIEQAANAARSSVNDALVALQSAGLVRRVERGVYQATPQS